MSLKLVAKNVAWQLALPQTGVQNNSALEGSVSLPGGAQENQEAACCREIPRTRKDGKKNKQANTKCPIYFPAQSLWESWRVDSGNNRVSGGRGGARGGGGGAASTCPQAPEKLLCLRTTALEPTLQNLCGTLPLTSPAPGTCFILRAFEARRMQFLSRVL